MKKQELLDELAMVEESLTFSYLYLSSVKWHWLRPTYSFQTRKVRKFYKDMYDDAIKYRTRLLKELDEV